MNGRLKSISLATTQRDTDATFKLLFRQYAWEKLKLFIQASTKWRILIDGEVMDHTLGANLSNKGKNH